jgi:hypothetical protein
MNNELQHYGIPKRSGRYPWGSGDRPYQGDNEKVSLQRERKNALKNRRELTTEELKKRIERLEIEKKFKDLSEDDIYPGKKKAEKALGTIGSNVMITVGTAVATGAAIYILKDLAGKVKKEPYKTHIIGILKESFSKKK